MYGVQHPSAFCISSLAHRIHSSASHFGRDSTPRLSADQVREGSNAARRPSISSFFFSLPSPFNHETMPTYSTEDPASRYDNPVSRSDEEDFTHSALPPSSRPASSASKGRTYDGETESDFDSEEEDAKLERELFDVEAQLPEQQQAGRKGGKEWVMHAVGKGGSRRSSNRAQVSTVSVWQSTARWRG